MNEASHSNGRSASVSCSVCSSVVLAAHMPVSMIVAEHSNQFKKSQLENEFYYNYEQEQ